MKIDLSQFRQTFLQESAEHIVTMESGLLALRSAPDDSETLNSVFRSAHSIKGGAGSFGMENLVRFTHALENLLERLRSAEIPVTDAAISMLLESIDFLRLLLDPQTQEMPAGAGELIEQMDRLTREGEQEGQAAPAAGHEQAGQGEPVQDEDGAGLKVYRVEFRPDREMFSSGTNPIVLLRNLAALGRVSAIHMHADELPGISELDCEQCYLSWVVELATRQTEQELREVFEFVEHLAEIAIRRLDNAPAKVETKPAKAEPASVAPSVTPAATSVTPAAASIISDAGTPQKSAKKKASNPTSGGESNSIRVATDKVDRLIDLVGELVIAHVMTAQMVENFTPESLSKLRDSVASMERNTRELHERAMAIRMLPVVTLFQRYTRTVYDIAKSTGKQIKLITSGEETEIDKSMLELLGDPLTHLIRNSADHGVESAEARVAAGKPAEGTIHLSAFHRAGRVVIEVADDGAGIDTERVRQKAMERGLINADAQLSEDQLRMLIFEPGFSTRNEVSDLSGRGVGMDVVKQNVQRLNGTVSVASTIGKGTTVSIELPLTLAIMEGLLVRIADQTLVLPLLAVVETIAPKPDQMQRIAEKGEVVVIRDQSIPLLRLRRFLNIAAETQSGDRPLVVVVETGRKKIGLMVDELLGQQQVVVKSLEKHLRKIDGLMGATILGNGCVAPIVDVACLANLNLYALQAARAA